MKRTRPKRDNDNASERLAEALDGYADAHGLLPGEVMPILNPYIRQSGWPRANRLTDRRIIVRLQLVFGNCFACGLQGSWDANEESWLKLDPHHLVGGTAGRADELCNLMPLCRKCHDKFQSDKAMFGFLLYRKWLMDRANTDWLRLTILYGKALPDLIIE